MVGLEGKTPKVRVDKWDKGSLNSTINEAHHIISSTEILWLNTAVTNLINTLCDDTITLAQKNIAIQSAERDIRNIDSSRREDIYWLSVHLDWFRGFAIDAIEGKNI